jgi:hypothetical protein
MKWDRLRLTNNSELERLWHDVQFKLDTRAKTARPHVRRLLGRIRREVHFRQYPKERNER